MQMTISQKVGIALAGVGALSILGLGWLYSWWLVPAIGRTGFQDAPVPGLVQAALGSIGAGRGYNRTDRRRNVCPAWLAPARRIECSTFPGRHADCYILPLGPFAWSFRYKWRFDGPVFPGHPPALEQNPPNAFPIRPNRLRLAHGRLRLLPGGQLVPLRSAGCPILCTPA